MFGRSKQYCKYFAKKNTFFIQNTVDYMEETSQNCIETASMLHIVEIKS